MLLQIIVFFQRINFRRAIKISISGARNINFRRAINFAYLPPLEPHRFQYSIPEASDKYQNATRLLPKEHI